MKKILILTMSSTNQFFANQIDTIKKTWAKDLPENIDWLYYDGNDKKEVTSLNGNHLSICCEDNLENTFKKTFLALLYINNNFKDKYDYIVRTNTSTYINVDFLNYFLNNINDNNDVTYCSDLYSLTEGYAPNPLDIYPRGNCFILPRKHVAIILSFGFSYMYLEHVDDMMIGNIINSYYIRSEGEYLSHIKGIPHGWYKSVPNVFNNGHKLCEYGHKDGGFDFYKQFISIQIKRYREREVENDNYIELDNLFKSNKDKNLEETFNKAIEYMKDPSIFIGSILGYMNYSEWKRMNKNELFWLEFSHKASDDAERKKYEEYINNHKMNQK